MQVDYVRVYQKIVGAAEDEKPDKNPGVQTDGVDDNLYGDYKLGQGGTTLPTDDVEETTTISGNNQQTTNQNGQNNQNHTSNQNNTGNQNHQSVVRPTSGSKAKVLKRTKVKSAVKKKASARVKLTFQRVKGAKKYQVQISRTKRFKKILVRKTVKKIKVTIKNKKLKNKKKLYVRVRAVGAKKWSKVKRIKIRK